MPVLRNLLLLAAALGLAGCPYVGERRYGEDIRDWDGDGAEAERFGGTDCADDDPEIVNCDEDGDGENSLATGGTDCDDSSAQIGANAVEICNGIDDDCDGLVDDQDADLALDSRTTWYRDADADGFGDADETIDACEPPQGYIAIAGDCDDARDDVSPVALEFCDLVDHNCDGDAVFNASDQLTYYVDADGDGYGRDELSTEQGCPGDAPTGTAPTNDDCDDADASIHPFAADTWYDGVDSDCDGADDYDQDGDGARYPAEDCDDADSTVGPGAAELCDGEDNDCDGLVDEVEDVAPFALTYFYLDVDGDGAGGGQPIASCDPVIPSGHVADGGDCDDGNPAVNPGGTEVCDGADNDCNGVVDDNAANRTTYYVDGDGDGFGDVAVLGCTLDDGWSRFDGDCNDGDATVYPGAFEVCGDAAIQDCDLAAPAFDCDGDGVDGAYTGNGGAGQDCDDSRAATYPGALEICDGEDNDCDGSVDNPPTEPVDNLTYYLDLDGDGYGAGAQQFPATCGEAVGMVTNDEDCNDLNASVHPGAGELCDGIDNDCNGLTDAGQIAAPRAYYLDLDGDGAGDPDAAYAQSCDPPQDGRTWVNAGTDCNDADPDIRPAAAEVCDGIDNDCDGLVDDQDSDTLGATWYADGDADGFGAGAPTSACSQPAGFVGNGLDCDDSRNDINPGVAEDCNGYDDDCDGFIDSADPDVVGNVDWFPDADADGYGQSGATAVNSCVQPVGHVANDLDCDDGAAGVSPAATEVCDGVDNDCDTLVDDADSFVVGGQLWYADSDQDGVGAGTAFFACAQPVDGTGSPTAVGITGDCDDTTDLRFPGNLEVCDGIDNDCDGIDDQTEAVPPVGSLDVWVDGDGDGYGTGPRQEKCFIGARAVVAAGWADEPGDCNDVDAGVNPGVPTESCSGGVGLDNDCDGLYGTTDPDYDGTSGFVYGQDADGDGFGSAVYTLDSCAFTPPSGYADTTDCNDLDARYFPGMSFYADRDGDGYGDALDALASADCTPPASGYVIDAADCDDANGATHPGGVELCDGIDNDCDALVDDEDAVVAGESEFFVDGDGDGWGDPFTRVASCDGQPPDTGGPWVQQGYDCDDADGSRNPGATETCSDSIDSDCDGGDDTTYDPYATVVGGTDYYLDADADSYFAQAAISSCDVPAGAYQLSPGTDCNDGDATRYPGAVIPVGSSQAETDLQSVLYTALCDNTTLQLDAETFVGPFELNYWPNLSIVGAGPGQTLLDGNGTEVALSGFADGMTLQGLEITNGFGAGAVAQLGFVSGVTFRDVEIHDVASATAGGALQLADASVLLEDVVIRNAVSNGTGGCLAVLTDTAGTQLTLARVHLDNCQGDAGASAIEQQGGSSVVATDLRITNAYAPSGEAVWTVGSGASVDLTDLVFHDNGGPILMTGTGSHALTRAWAAGNPWGFVELSDSVVLTVDNVVAVGNGAASRPTFGAYTTADVSITNATFAGEHLAVLADAGATGSVQDALFHKNNQTLSEFTAGNLTLTNAMSSSADLSGTVQTQSGVSESVAMSFHRYHDLMTAADVDLAPVGGWEGVLGAHHGASVGDWDYSLDADSDGLPDGWERLWLGGDALPGEDPDADSLTNADEYAGTSTGTPTHPGLADTDADGAPDDTDTAPLDQGVQ